MASQGRNFSFDPDDENALPSNQHHYQRYHDSSPRRDIISPPPQYSSPPPQEPVSPTRAYHGSSHHSRGYSLEREITRRPVPTSSAASPPPPPPHHGSPRGLSRLETHQSQGYRPTSIVTPGMDNFSDRSQGGGLGYVAQGVADRNERESGLEALRSIQPSQQPQPYDPYDHDYSSPYGQRPPSQLPDRTSYGSTMGLAAGAATPGNATPDLSFDHQSARYSTRSIPLDEYPSHSNYGYHDSPYHGSNQNFHPAVNDASINPHNIVDDGDDGFMPEPQRKSMFLKQGTPESSSRGPAAAAGSAGILGGVFGRKQKAQVASGSYNPVADNEDGPGRGEKSEWLSRQTKGTNKMRWIVGIVIGLVIVIAIVAGIVGGVLGTRNNGSSGGGSGGGGAVPGSTNNAETDLAQNGDLNKDSDEIKALMNNKDLHKVFPAIDYTPWGTQYPLCMTYPPSQNNITRDMAILSQLTNQVRLYGTDCNQTEMVLHAIDRLELKDMKVWLGVWIDTNQTTNDRQLEGMYRILEEVDDHSIFKGVIVGNEALYRAGEDKAQSEQELITLLEDTRSKFQDKRIRLPLATSDLGDNWNPNLVLYVDIVMANIHPFFAGAPVDTAAGWTWSFWQDHNVNLTPHQPNIKHIISETGWPSGGGTDCGGATGDCAPGQVGAVASVENMNTFMNDWVCQAMDNGTAYFWFEAFDEPWKVSFNEPGKEWEDKWGLMYPDRTLKPGLKIPDCDGKTVT